MQTVKRVRVESCNISKQISRVGLRISLATAHLDSHPGISGEFWLQSMPTVSTLAIQLGPTQEGCIATTLPSCNHQDTGGHSRIYESPFLTIGHINSTPSFCLAPHSGHWRIQTFVSIGFVATSHRGGAPASYLSRSELLLRPYFY